MNTLSITINTSLTIRAQMNIVQDPSSALPVFSWNAEPILISYNFYSAYLAVQTIVLQAAIAYQIIPNVSSDLEATLKAHAPDHDLINGNQTLLCTMQKVHL